MLKGTECAEGKLFREVQYVYNELYFMIVWQIKNLQKVWHHSVVIRTE